MTKFLKKRCDAFSHISVDAFCAFKRNWQLK